MATPKTPETKPEPQAAAAAQPGKAGAARLPTRVSYAGDLVNRAIFADGIHGVSLRAGVARIDLYQVVMSGDERQAEQRVVSHRLVLPLPALDELAAMLNSMRQALQKATAQQREQAKT
jgi:hypothetical protein